MAPYRGVATCVSDRVLADGEAILKDDLKILLKDSSLDINTMSNKYLKRKPIDKSSSSSCGNIYSSSSGDIHKSTLMKHLV